MKYTYIIIDDDSNSVFKTKALADGYKNLSCIGVASNYDDGINLILEHQPKLVFLEINPSNKESHLSFSLISELYRYLKTIPKIIITTNTREYAFDALKYEVVDYMLKPLNSHEFRKAILKLLRDIEVTYANVPSIVEMAGSSAGSNLETVATIINDSFIEQTMVVEPQEAVTTAVEEVEEENTIQVSEIAVDEQINGENIIETDENIELETNEIENVASEQLEESESIEPENEAVTLEEIEIQNTTSDSSQEIETDTNEIEENAIENEENTSENLTIIKPISTTAVIDEPLVICVKSYGDYRYIDSRDVLYLEADNNSTDIHLKDGEMVTAFKTLKHFENVLPETQFLRIHNSYIININQVARIHTGNAVCYIKNSTIKLPFSKSYKENVELIIHRIASGNYLEI